MGISILEFVLETLREAGFAAEAAYPGQRFSGLSGTAAAVHIEQVDCSRQQVTVEVVVACPAAMGGAACETEALRITQVLCAAGSECIQKGCAYDGASQAYTVTVLATFTCAASAEDCTMGPGFQVYINNVQMPYATAFTSQKESDHKVVYSVGVTLPEGSTAGPFLHTFRLEELVPVGYAAAAEESGTFAIRVETEHTIERFFACRWTSVQREYTKEGLRRIRTGIARVREEVANG